MTPKEAGPETASCSEEEIKRWLRVLIKLKVSKVKCTNVCGVVRTYAWLTPAQAIERIGDYNHFDLAPKDQKYMVV